MGSASQRQSVNLNPSPLGLQRGGLEDARVTAYGTERRGL